MDYTLMLLISDLAFLLVGGASALQVLYCKYNALSKLPLLQQDSHLKVHSTDLKMN